MILDKAQNLTLRPMKYPQFYDMYKTGVKNNWTVEEVNLSSDLNDLNSKLTPSEKHIVNRLVAFFATGDTIVNENIAINLFKHINSPEARMYISRQIFEEALHSELYLTSLDTYIPNMKDRSAAFDAINEIPSIKVKADFCFKYLDSIKNLELNTEEDIRKFVLNLTCFCTCVEGIFFFAAFSYVFYLRSKGYMQGFATANNWILRDESMHLNFGLEVLKIIRKEYPQIFDLEMEKNIREMIKEAINCEYQFAEDLLSGSVSGISLVDMKEYLNYLGNMRLLQLGYTTEERYRNPFSFMEMQDVQSLANFFERRVSEYQAAVVGEVSLDEDF